VKPGDHVIPLYTPECRQCKSCLSGKTNLCTAIRATQGKGADARRHQPLQLQGAADLPLHGLLDLLELHRAAGDRGREDPRGRAVPDQLLHRLRRHHRRRRGGQHRQGPAGDNVVVFGLGGIGLNVIQGAKLVGANRIVGVDINPDREEWGRKFGMTDFLNRRA
jgi:S-(hydroxymethyl)glutathione dehydrogenase/alcohol dehydrogenase